MARIEAGPVGLGGPSTGALIIEGRSIVVARAWITDPEAWKQLAQSVRAGEVRRFDATQLQVEDPRSIG